MRRRRDSWQASGFHPRRLPSHTLKSLLSRFPVYSLCISVRSHRLPGSFPSVPILQPAQNSSEGSYGCPGSCWFLQAYFYLSVVQQSELPGSSATAGNISPVMHDNTTLILFGRVLGNKDKISFTRFTESVAS